jgi:plasmid stability protein
MAKMIQLRNVPDALHRGLKARAAMAGMSLSDYLLAEIKEIAERPTLAELRERLHKRKPVSAQIDTAWFEKSARRDDCPGCVCRSGLASSDSCRAEHRETHLFA